MGFELPHGQVGDKARVVLNDCRLSFRRLLGNVLKGFRQFAGDHGGEPRGLLASQRLLE